MENNLASFTDILSDEIPDSQPMSLTSIFDNNFQGTQECSIQQNVQKPSISRPLKHAGQHGEFRSIEEIDPKYREVFTYPFFNLVQSRVIEDALYSDKSMVVCAPTGSGKTVVFEMAIVQLLMEIEEKNYDRDFKIIYMAPVKALCTERLTEWYPKFTKLGMMCIEVTGDTDVDFNNLKPYRVIITTPEKWDIMTRRWRDHRGLVQLVKLFLIDEVHILNDAARGPVLEAVVSRMRTIESSTQSEYRIEQLQRQYQSNQESLPIVGPPPRIRFVAVSATVSNPEDVAAWLGNSDNPAVYYKFGDECRPVKLKKVVEGYPCPDGTSIFKFDIILNYKLWPIIQKYHDGKPTLIFCNTRKSVALTAEALSREITISFNPDQRAKLTAIASTIKNKKLQALVLAGVGCHHAGLLYEERLNIEMAFRNRDLPILITTTTLAMGVNLPAHLVIIKNTQQYVNGAYQEYSISTVLQMVGRAGRPQFDTEATAVIMTRASDKPRYEALVCGSEPLQSYLHKRLPENLNSEAALGTVKDVAQCVQWLRSTFLYVRAAKDPKRYLGLPNNAPLHLISQKIEELCVIAMNGLASAGLISMDEASCIESTEAGRLMSIFYLDLVTMKHIMKIEGTATLEQVLWVVCESHELSDMHLRVDERRCLNALNRNSNAATIRFPMKGKISTRQMKLNCVIQAVLGCLPIPDPSINQEAMKVMRIADRVCKCLLAYVTRPDLISEQPVFFSAVLNSLILCKCVAAHLWENSHYVSKQLKGIGPTFSTLLATAGKINFMLLEESHPRDLERIMNKGPPAGNVLRKQVSLLPKYQITMTPVDEKVVTMQLTLLNHNYLAENMENLTAGDRHKSYIIVGDSENHLLLLTSFQDKDLIGMYDGRITHEIKRKHSFEHKITTHCVSSKFVGIDAQCEYVFKDLESAQNNIGHSSCYFNKDTISNRPTQRQTCITDVYKERKRRNKGDSAEICQSKEKKKRESVLAEKIRLLKESFGKTTKCVKEELHKSAEMSNKVVHDILNINDTIPVVMGDKLSNQTNNTTGDIIDLVSCDVNNDLDVINQIENVNFDDFGSNEYVDDSKINAILNDIESEICKEEENVKPLEKFSYNKYCDIPKINTLKRPAVKNQTNFIKKPKKSNFNFMELLNRNVDFHEEEKDCKPITEDTGFSNTIKLHIDKYLQETRSSTKTYNSLIEHLIGNEESMDLEKIKKDNNIDCLPLVKLNSDKLDEHTTMNKSNTNIIQEHNSGVQSEYASTHTQSKENMMLSQQLYLDKSIIPLHNDNILNQSFITNSRNTLHERTPTNIEDQNVNSVLIEGSENKRDNKKIIDNEYITNDHRKLKIINIAHSNISSQYIYDKKPSIENLCKNNDTVLSEKSDHEYQYIDNYNEFKESKKADTKPSYLRNLKYSAINIDISTCHSENLQVHRIKKIKMDVDVTEIVTNTNTNNDFNNCGNALFPYITQDNSSKLDKSMLTSQDDSCQTQILKPITYIDDINTTQKYEKDTNKYVGEKPNICPTKFEKSVTEKDTDSAIRVLDVKEEDKERENEIQIRNLLTFPNSNIYPVITSKIDEMKELFTDFKEPKLDVDIDVTNNNIKSNTQVPYIAQDNTLKSDKSVSIYQDNLILKLQELNNTTYLDKQFSVQNNDTHFKNNFGANKPKICSINQGKSVIEEKKNNLQYVLENKEYANPLQMAKPVFVNNKKTSFRIKPEITVTNKLVSDVNEPIVSQVQENPPKENTLGSILQKYSRVIRKNKNGDEKNVNTKLLQSNKEISRDEQKNKRPFKITDIDKIEQTLPALLIGEPIPQQPLLPIAETPNYSTPIQLPPSPIAETPKNLTPPVLNKNTEKNNIVSEFPSIVASEESQIEYNDDIIPEDLESLTPKPSKDFMTTDYKLDDSMLNPKTLLQCLINDEPEIIPPPPEFSDLNYSPPQAAEKDYNNTHESELEGAQLVNDKYEVLYNDNTKNEYRDFGKTQFHSNSANEIETLLLSNEDYSERKPWVITQSPAYRNTTPTGYTARRANLNQFKFTNKKKFKIK